MVIHAKIVTSGDGGRMSSSVNCNYDFEFPSRLFIRLNEKMLSDKCPESSSHLENPFVKKIFKLRDERLTKFSTPPER